MSDMLSARELAQRLGVSDDTVYRRTATGEIPHFRVGPAIRYDWAEVEVVWPILAATPGRKPGRKPGRRLVAVTKAPALALTDEQIGRLSTDGLVYFVQSVDGGAIKIGLTADLERRMAVMQSHSPTRLVVLATMLGGRRLEYELHHRFHAHRLHGEWFKPSAPGLRDLIREAVA